MRLETHSLIHEQYKYKLMKVVIHREKRKGTYNLNTILACPHLTLLTQPSLDAQKPSVKAKYSLWLQLFAVEPATISDATKSFCHGELSLHTF